MKYTTKKTIGIVVLALITLQIMIVVSSRPLSDLNATVISVLGLMFFIGFSFLFGIFVVVNGNSLIRTDFFFFKKRLPIQDIDVIRYQPSYGIGKSISSLYFFSKNRSSAVFMLTNLWFAEQDLAKLLHELMAQNPSIKLDSEAEGLLEKYH